MEEFKRLISSHESQFEKKRASNESLKRITLDLMSQGPSKQDKLYLTHLSPWETHWDSSNLASTQTV